MKKIFLFIVLFIVSISSFSQARALTGLNPSGMPGFIYRDTLRNLTVLSPLYPLNDSTIGIDTSKLWNLSGNAPTGTYFLGNTTSTDLPIRTNNTQRMVIKNDGKVGINEASPVVNFQVNAISGFGDSVTALNAVRNFNIVGTTAGLRILRITPNINTSAPTVELMHRTTKDGANTVYWDMYLNSTGFNIRDRVTDYTPFAISNTAPSNSFFISSTGQIGIGTASPSEMFQVEKNQNANLRLLVKNTTNGTAGRAAVVVESASSKNASLQSFSSSFSGIPYWASSGFFGTNQASCIISAYDASGVLRFQTGGTSSSEERMTILSTGNVGIGTTSPSSLFSVGSSSQFQVTSAGLIKAEAGSAQVALVAGTKAITITGLTTSSLAFVQMVTPSTVTTTVGYKAVCTANTLTITAYDATGATATSDVSTLNYRVIAK